MTNNFLVISVKSLTFKERELAIVILLLTSRPGI